MECVSEDFERIHEPRAGAVEVDGAVDQVDAVAADTGEIAPTGVAAKEWQIGKGAFHAKSTASDDEHFRSGRDDLLPIEGA